MSEFFVIMNSNAAPFFSDTTEKFVEADDAQDALEKAVVEYKHPAGLYAAEVYANANAYHKREKYLTRWMSERALKAYTGVS